MKGLCIACTLAGLLLSGSAAAQPIGKAKDLAIGAERLFGFYLGEQDRELRNGVDVETDISTFSLLWNWNPSFLNQPRFAIDYFVIDGLSVGGSFGVFVAKEEDADVTGFLFSGRAGYLLNISDAVGFWPRGGLVYYNLNRDAGLGGDMDQFALSLEAMFTLAPRDGWAFVLGPTVDFGFTGENENLDFHEYTIGIMIGITGWVSL